jgi:hypothetical protein
MSETKAKRGPKKSAADKLAELVASKRKEGIRLSDRATALANDAERAWATRDAALAELKQLEAAHKALVGGGDA